MIEYIKGNLVEQSPAHVVIETGGVGYFINTSLITGTDVQGKESTKLFIYEAIREDAHILYGFSSKKERDLFLLLISVSGVGASTARIILSSYSVSELISIISSEQTTALNMVKGIGAKTAQRIIVDLKDKVILLQGAEGSSSTLPFASTSSPISQTKSEAVAALVMLGYTNAASSKAVDKVLKSEPELEVSRIIKKALQQL